MLEWPQTVDEQTRHLGRKLFEEKIREKTDTPENWDKFVVIDVETGDYTISDADPLVLWFPDAPTMTDHLYVVRIGYDEARQLGMWLERPRYVGPMEFIERPNLELVFPQTEDPHDTRHR